MKQLHMALPSRLNGLRVFAGEGLETYDSLTRQAQDQIEEIKRAYHKKNLSFEYADEVIRGKFVTAVEGEFPGTYMIVLRIASSRVCSGPCFLHWLGRRIGAIVVSGKNGIVGITAKAIPQKHPSAKDSFHLGLADCA